MIKAIIAVCFCLGIIVSFAMIVVETESANRDLKRRIDEKNKLVRDVIVQLNECKSK